MSDISDFQAGELVEHKYKEELEASTFQAIFSKATTTVDGGWRVSFDVTQQHASEIIKLYALKDKLLQLAVIPIEED